MAFVAEASKNPHHHHNKNVSCKTIALYAMQDTSLTAINVQTKMHPLLKQNFPYLPELDSTGTASSNRRNVLAKAFTRTAVPACIPRPQNKYLT